MQIPKISSILLSTAISLSMLLGCGEPSGPKRLPAFGAVTFDGKPVEKGSLTMVPSDGAHGPTVGANITNGTYNIPVASGPVEGTYAVKITARRKTGRKIRVADGPYAAKPRFIDEEVQFAPPRYNKNTKLVIDIAPGKTEYNFPLTSD